MGQPATASSEVEQHRQAFFTRILMARISERRDPASRIPAELYSEAFKIAKSHPEVITAMESMDVAERAYNSTVMRAFHGIRRGPRHESLNRVHDELESARVFAEYVGPRLTAHLNDMLAQLRLKVITEERRAQGALRGLDGLAQSNAARAQNRIFKDASRGRSPEELIGLARSDPDVAKAIMSNPILSCFRVGKLTIAEILKEDRPAEASEKM